MSLINGSANSIKYFLFGFNIIFLITGIILMAIGIGVGSIYSDYDPFLTGRFFSIPTFLIVIASFIIIISIFGCFGAFKENYLLVLIFSVLLGIIFILELSAGISGYVLKGDAYDLINKELSKTLNEYSKEKQDDVTRLWDSMQRDYNCCGVQSYKDWGTRFGNDLPISCCTIPVGAVGSYSCTNAIENVDRNKNGGCLSGFSDYIGKHAVTLGAAGVIIAVLQFFGVLFSCYLAREIKIKNGISGFFG